METDHSEQTLDKFERARDSLWGAPGFQRRNSTITSAGWSFIPQGSWIVESIRTDDNMAVFLQVIDKDGGQRIVLPNRVCQAIYRQYESILKARRKVRGQRAAETRKRKQNHTGETSETEDTNGNTIA